ncbi:hypothetical protein ACFE04_011167 [Oxalis oulophora]
MPTQEWNGVEENGMLKLVNDQLNDNDLEENGMLKIKTTDVIELDTCGTKFVTVPSSSLCAVTLTDTIQDRSWKTPSSSLFRPRKILERTGFGRGISIAELGLEKKIKAAQRRKWLELQDRLRTVTFNWKKWSKKKSHNVNL